MDLDQMKELADHLLERVEEAGFIERDGDTIKTSVAYARRNARRVRVAGV